jgi:hypothetical protein
MYPNHTECITCTFSGGEGRLVTCEKHGKVLPYPNPDCLICRDWQDRTAPFSKGEYYKEHYFTESGKLYRYNPYFIKKRTVLCDIADLPPISSEQLTP